MRVIGGEKGGLRLSDFKGDWIRPTSDKVKGAIFSSLMSTVGEIDIFCDLFAGTGGMGIEALSRGAECAYFFDKDKRSIKIVKENLKKTGYEKKSHVYLMSAEKGLDLLNQEHIVCTVIFMDPPYRKVPELLSLFDDIAQKKVLSPDGVIVLEHDKSDILPEKLGEYCKIKEKRYASTVISVYQGEEE